MKRSKILILASVLIFPVIARSQNEVIKDASKPPAAQNASVYSGKTEDLSAIPDRDAGSGLKSSDIFLETGGLYLEPGWVAGHVTMTDNTVLDNIQLRYDIYHQQLQFIKDKDTLAFGKPAEISYFMFNGRKFIHTEFINDDAVSSGYFEVIIDDNCKLLLRRTIKYHLEQSSAPGMAKDEYVRENQYYIMKPHDFAWPVGTGRKGIINALIDKEAQIREYIDSNKLKMNTYNDLKQVVDYYNSLM